jgi:hypothetical protein
MTNIHCDVFHNRIKKITPPYMLNVYSFIIFLGISLFFSCLKAQSLDIPTRKYGLSIGNSKNFTGLRINFRDSRVQKITGINVTFWQPKNNNRAVVHGFSLGILPRAGYLKGLQMAVLGAGAEKDLKGMSLGLLGIGAGNDLSGISIAGIGVGSGGSMKGINIGGLGAGAGGDVRGIVIAGLGAGSGGNIRGITIGGLGAGASGNIEGLAFALLGAGAGGDIKGITIAGLGAGAGGNIHGLTVGGLGAGCGGELQGIAAGLVGAGAPSIKGIALGGIGAGGEHVQGITAAILLSKISDDGTHKGISVAIFNQIKGSQTGISLGVLNYSWHMNGFQIGVINYIKDNPKYLKVLPIVNWHFD